MTPKKRWPNEADHARTEAISQAKKILAQMDPMKDALEAGKPVSSMELQIRMGRMSDAANRIIQELVAVGPQKFLD
jgi:hypothetical protein